MPQKIGLQFFVYRCITKEANRLGLGLSSIEISFNDILRLQESDQYFHQVIMLICHVVHLAEIYGQSSI